MQLELNSLRSEKQRLQRRNEELLRSQRQTPSPPSPGVKNGSPVQFTPQRISPVSLESLGARMRSSSSSPSIIRRDVATQAAGKVTATRDAAVGAKLSVRDVATQQAEAIYSQAELKQRIEQAIGERRQQRLRQLISVGTQMYVPQREQREKGMQTVPERPVLKHNVSISAKPATRESFTSCQPEVRSVGSSEHRITDVLCEKCAITKRSVSVSCGTEEPLERPKPAQLLPGRSNTFSLGEHEQLAIKRKAIGCQTLSTPVHSASSQTTTTTVRSTGAQVMPEQQQMATQCAPVEATSRQTDTNGLQRLTRSSVKAEQLMAPLVRPTTCHTGSNTEPPPLAKPERLTVHSACNTEQVRKRDVGCGDIVKPHISIACAANYCDSCKEAIQVLAKDFSKAETSDLAPVSPTAATPTAASSTTSTVRRSSSADSRIPRPKHLTSPSPVRKQFQRQNTYTLPTAAGAAATPKSPKAEGKTLLR